ncbi:MAG: ABC transporter permease [Spirochaetales bacterium]|jgi:putative ABC transport system permease protein|nr:ABC transporter permease [Spirochaetales bacterium]
MNNSIQIISYTNLLFGFIPVLIILGIIYKWSLNLKNALYAVLRMLVQLLLIGYILAYIFESDSGIFILAILFVMLISSCWISLGTIKEKRFSLLKVAFVAIVLGGGSTLLFVTQGVLRLDPWYLPQYMIPIAGMIFANSMNSVSLAAERLNAELDRGVPYDEAQKIALQAALIPITNSLFAVGLVSIPGMMTGQILSGVNPPIAARYQIMVMCMIFGSTGISAATFLAMAKTTFCRDSNTL